VIAYCFYVTAANAISLMPLHTDIMSVQTVTLMGTSCMLTWTPSSLKPSDAKKWRLSPPMVVVFKSQVETSYMSRDYTLS
jgi:hypothetical protein